jgi:hypothetical protein
VTVATGDGTRIERTIDIEGDGACVLQPAFLTVVVPEGAP